MLLNISEAEKTYAELKRVSQYIETVVEYLKVVLLGLETGTFDGQILLGIVSDIKNNVERFIVERINVFEPEYCYLMGMILANYTDAKKEDVLVWFADSISLSEQFNQSANYEYFKETCRQLEILGEVEEIISIAKSKSSESK
ncbi:MAG: hypothetical protein MZW92_17090 [Comamonadaceae bacterium]|nr:hypothetical protein [Comamonadaceae bacterium]